jgi:hypothetical protein
MKIEINISDKFFAFVKKVCSTRNAVFGVSAILFGLGVLLFGAPLPSIITFSPNTVISSSQVNTNFKNLWDKVNEHDTSINNLKAGGSDWWNKNPDDTLYYNSGNVGIGTTSPLRKLHIYAATGFPEILMESNYGADLTGRMWGLSLDNTNGKLNLRAVDSNISPSSQVSVMSFTPSGNVGIGTTLPNTIFHVRGADNNSYGQLEIESTGYDARLSLYNTSGASTTGRGDIIMSRTPGFEGMRFCINNLDNMILDENGSVGIGTTNPRGKLEVDSNYNEQLRVRNTNTSADKYWRIGAAQDNGFIIFNQDSKGMFIDDNNPSGWTQYSDQRLKTNIQELTNTKGLSAIEKLNPITFNWLDTKALKTTQTGFIAQQVQEVFPDLVSIGPEATINLTDGTSQTIQDPLGLNYTGFIPYLVKGIQELKKQKDDEINSLKAANQALEDKIQTMNRDFEKRIKALEDKIDK